MDLVWLRDQGRCVGCGARAGRQPINFHHVFPKAKWPELIDKKENVYLVCHTCHAHHETAYERLPLTRMTDCFVLVENARMGDYLRRNYR